MFVYLFVNVTVFSNIMVAGREKQGNHGDEYLSGEKTGCRTEEENSSETRQYPHGLYRIFQLSQFVRDSHHGMDL